MTAWLQSSQFFTEKVPPIFSMVLESANVVSLKKHAMVGYFAVMASDTMAIKPGLQFTSQVNGLIGLMDPPMLLPETVKELVTKSDAEVADHKKLQV